MTATVTKLNTDTIKEASIPAVLSKMEEADITIVLHFTGGRWDLQFLKGQAPIWSLIGMFHTIITHFSNVANGLYPVKQTKQ